MTTSNTWSTHLPRNLPPGVDPARIARLRFDVVVAGTGSAGASCALAAAEKGLRVAVVAKGGSTRSNTAWARGGVAAVLDPTDSFESHVADTMACGGALCERATVNAVVAGGPAAIERLIDLGAEFDHADSGDLALGREGGHRYHRIVHAQGDATGPTVQAALSRALEAHPLVTSFEDAFALDVMADHHGHAAGLLTRLSGGQVVAIEAPNVVLATGGAGQLYRETTNPVLATGDGVAMGLRAGAAVRDMEFVQFHPTCLYIAGAARVLISEIVRGAGGVLRDRTGARFMPRYHPDAELAPRDVVSRAITERMAHTGTTNVLLDLSQLDADPHALFPGVSRTCRAFGIDIAQDLVPVRPGAHYMIGGLQADLDGRTTVPGLLAVGECASTGLHGANRMGSNSLLEGLVLGDRCGRALEASAMISPEITIVAPTTSAKPVVLNLTDLTYSLKSLMWREVGVERTGEGLGEAAGQLEFWASVSDRLAPAEPAAWELRNMLLLARAITWSAASRCESRGAHCRVDCPDMSDRPSHTVLTSRRVDETTVTFNTASTTVKATPEPVG